MLCAIRIVHQTSQRVGQVEHRAVDEHAVVAVEQPLARHVPIRPVLDDQRSTDVCDQFDAARVASAFDVQQVTPRREIRHVDAVGRNRRVEEIHVRVLVRDPDIFRSVGMRLHVSRPEQRVDFRRLVARASQRFALSIEVGHADLWPSVVDVIRIYRLVEDVAVMAAAIEVRGGRWRVARGVVGADRPRRRGAEALQLLGRVVRQADHARMPVLEARYDVLVEELAVS